MPALNIDMAPPFMSEEYVRRKFLIHFFLLSFSSNFISATAGAQK